MISFFRINDPLRIIGVLLLLLLIRLPLILNGIDLITPELSWLTIGEALANDKKMYIDIWDNTGPLATGIYWILHELFGKSQFAYQCLSIVLVMYQAFIFNRAMIRNGVYNEKTFVPALLYMLFMCMSFDFFTLPPVLLAMTFLIHALRNVIRLNNQSVAQEIFEIGVYTGIASLIYLPSVYFLIMLLLSLVLFRISSFQTLFLAIYGFILAIMVYLIYPYYNDSIGEFLEMYVYSYFTISSNNYISLKDLLIISAIPAFILVVSVFDTFTNRNFVNFQVSCQQIMILWTITSVIAIIWNVNLAPFQLMLFVPSLSFFASHFLLSQRKKLLTELYFLISGVLIISSAYVSYYQIIPDEQFIFYKNLKVINTTPQSIQDKKILVIGDPIDAYQHNSLATKYFNSKLSGRHFTEISNYATIGAINREFNEDMPEVIIDNRQVIDSLFAHAPILSAKYKKIPHSGKAIYYVLKEGNTEK